MTSNRDHTVTSSGSNVVSSGTRWPCPGPSTIVPMLGISFREAATRIAALVKEQDGLPDTPEADSRSDEITEQWEMLGRAVLGSIPRTPADSVAVIDTALCPAIGPNMERTTKELFQRVRGVLVQAALDAAQREDRADRNPLVSHLRRWLELEAAMDTGSDAEMMDAAEESFALARKIAAFDGDPVLGMAVKVLLLWAGHPAASGSESVPCVLPRPPAAANATNEEDAIIFGLVGDALKAVPELVELMNGAAPQPEDTAAAFIDAIDSLEDRALPKITIPITLTDAMAEAGAEAAGCTPEAFRRGIAAIALSLEAA